MMHISNVTPATATNDAAAAPAIGLPDESDHTLIQNS